MKADCPVCKHTCEGETALSVTLAMADHIKVNSDEKHLFHLSKLIEQIDREVNFAVTAAQDGSAIRQLLYDKCAGLDMRLQTLYLYATSHLAIAIQASRDLLLECGDQARVSEQKAARRLWDNLRESLLVAERKFRR